MLTRGLFLLQESFPLFEGEFLVSIRINSANRCLNLAIESVVAVALQETLKTFARNFSFFVAVNSVEGSLLAVVAAIGENPLLGVNAPLQVEFGFNDLDKSMFLVAGESVALLHTYRLSLEGDIFQVVVLAGQQHLLETKPELLS